MTLNELKRQFEIHKIQWQKIEKKGARETFAIEKAIRFFNVSKSLYADGTAYEYRGGGMAEEKKSMKAEMMVSRKVNGKNGW